MNSENPPVSIVIPCFNEEDVLPQTLKSIQEHTRDINVDEIIVVDNGSEDNSHEIAKEYGCTVLLRPDAKTVGSVRNEGVRKAEGIVILFLDADVQLTDQWSANIQSAIATTINEDCIVGSHCSVPNEGGYINRHWFSAIEKNSASHVGTGHMLILKSLFMSIEGFNENLVSGEDYDLCMKVKAVGGRIIEDQSLKVYHEGYPEHLCQFFQRELWHGEGDWISLQAVASSKVLLASLVFILGLLFSIGVSIYSPILGALSLLLTFLYCLVLSVLKFGIVGGVRSVSIRAWLFSVYMTARVFGIVKRIKSK